MAACETPFIVTDRCGTAPPIGGTRLIIPHVVGEIQHALVGLLEDFGHSQWCLVGCEALARKLSSDDLLDQIDDLYRRCTSGKGR